MVDPMVLASDVLSNTLFLALPAALWLFVYLWAWERGPVAAAAGFSRRVFWLLLPIALVGSLANAPFFTWEGSVLAINLGGASVPIALALYLPARWLGPSARRELAIALGILAGETAAIFALGFVRTPTLGGAHGVDPFPFVVVALGISISYLLLRRPSGAPRRTSGAFVPTGWGLAALASAALLVTYETTMAVPGVGILSVFPFYLLAPIAVGAGAVFLARPLFGYAPLAGVPFAYSASTLGVVVGADLLHEGPLYGGTAGFLSIGGAGLLDLVYLTGLLAAASAFLLWSVTHAPGESEGWPAGVRPPPTHPTAAGRFREALRRRRRGDPSGAVAAALAAADSAVDQARALRGLPPVAPGEPPWRGIEVPRWVGSDHANLRAAGAAPTPSSADAERALVTSQFLVLLASDVSQRAVGSVRERVAAFLIDLTLLTAPAVFLWGLLALVLPGDPVAVIGSVPYGTALLGYSAYGMLYFLLAEWRYGTTFGKRVMHLVVRARDLGRARPLGLVVRNAVRLVPLTIISQLIGEGLVLILDPSSAGLPAGGVALNGLEGWVFVLAGVVGLLLAGGVSVAVMLLSPERQRVGDLWGGTVVLREVERPAERPPALAPGPVPGG